MKKTAPIIIVIIACVYLLAYLVILINPMFANEISHSGKIILGMVALGMVATILALIYTLKIRLKEIKEENDDDLSKY